MKYSIPDKIRAILLKFFGVICYTHPSVIVKYSQELRKADLTVTNTSIRLAFHKAEKWAFTRKRAGYEFNNAEVDRYKKIFFNSLGIERNKIDELDRKLAYSLEKSNYWTNSIKMAPGLVEFLDKVSERSLRCVVITDSEIDIRDQLRAFNIEKYIDLTFNPNSVGVTLPAPQILQQAMRTLELKLSRCLLVGSRPLVDGQAAKTLQMPYVLVKNPSTDMFEQKDEDFEYYTAVQSLSEIIFQ